MGHRWRLAVDIYSLGASIDILVEADPDCFITQTDFLSKFNKFPNVYRPSVYKQTVTAFNPSECAHTCMVESNFTCLGFDYCETAVSETGGDRLGSCFFLQDRLISAGSSEQSGRSSQKPQAGSMAPPNKSTGCDHYSRSYLADFTRIEYRKIDDGQLIDCTAFQFCFDPSSSGPMQSCTMIESKPTGDPNDYRVVVSQNENGETVFEGRFFKPDENCHLFSLRRDSSEAHLRELALGSMTKEEYEADREAKIRSNGISLGGAIVLYFGVTILFALLAFGVCYAENNNEYIRQKIERVQLLLHI